MGKFKRVRDTTKKKTLRVFVEGYRNPFQMWTDGESFYIYNHGWEEINSGDLGIFGPKWGEPEETDRIGVYDTNKPTNIGTFEDGFTATYTFVDYDEETILKEGTVVDGGTPEAPEDPTREGYTFTGWDPAVGPISKNTEYIAQYTENEPELDPEPEPEPEPDPDDSGR